MTPVVKMTMNTARFNRVLQRVFAQSSRTFPDFINGQAYRLALDAVNATERADANRIAWSLGQTDRRFLNKRTGGKLKTPRRVYGNSAASLNLYRIVNWRRKRRGSAPLGGQAMSGPARKLRAAALRSTGYIASGWLWAIKRLAIATRDKKGQIRFPVKLSGKPKGYARVATFTLNGVVACEIGNTALLAVSAARTGLRKGNPMRVAERGLAIARQMTAANMIEHLRQKLQPVLDRHSARR